MKLKRSDYPLVLRVMQGPCEQVCKVFLMEEDLGEEVTYDVSQHIHSHFFLKGDKTIASVSPTRLYFFISLSCACFVMTFSSCPPGGAVYKVWDACPEEFHHQAEGGGGSRGAETQEKVQELKDPTTPHRLVSFCVTSLTLTYLCLFVVCLHLQISLPALYTREAALLSSRGGDVHVTGSRWPLPPAHQTVTNISQSSVSSAQPWPDINVGLWAMVLLLRTPAPQNSCSSELLLLRTPAPQNSCLWHHSSTPCVVRMLTGTISAIVLRVVRTEAAL